ncbi:hypothetical protein JVU11DRAFT_5266 [Chiua virens]|nr:hypothetical protein JVU11DRAFT_5266 [Chiua virens]
MFLLPGQPVPVRAGEPPPVLNGQLRASLGGILDDNTLAIRRQRPHPPAPNAIILGTVTRLSPLQAVVAISVVDGIPLPPGEEFTGVIRTQDIRATEKDKVKIADCFRGGDVVKGLVISLGDARSYYITTARNDLGVIFATSEAGVTMDPVSWQEMRCPSTGKLEKRKCAKPDNLVYMTAVLSAVDVLRRDSVMASLDDNQIKSVHLPLPPPLQLTLPSYSSPTDWKTKYYEVADMLAETRAELDEFHTSSKELEEELIKEIERTEKAQQDLKVKVSRVESERDEWKSKFMSLQTSHNTTTTSLQRELDTVRQESQRLKVQLRELEMGNDDLERNERAVSSTLADVETKYSRVLEEKILLEHELLDKASLEEECQRLRDELRDAGVEMSILKDQLSATRANPPSASSESSTSETASSSFPLSSPPSTEESLLNTPPPPDFNLSELSTDKSSVFTASRPPSTSFSSTSGQSTLLQRTGFQPGKFYTSASTPPVTRSSTLPTLSASRSLTPRTPFPRPNLVASASSTITSAIPIAASKSKGVQMVSEMRARVKNLEQKIHTRVPRLRMGSNAGRQGVIPLVPSVMTPPASNMVASIASRSGAQRTATFDSKLAKPNFQRPGVETSPPKSGATTPDPNQSGWVLIMDDTPSPAKDTDKERRRVSSPSASNSFRSGIPTSASSPTFSRSNPLALGMNSHRPQSRLSGESQSTTATISTIPTPSSRPTTPTLLPIPTYSSYASGGIGFKRSTGPGVFAKSRGSLGSSNAGSPSSSEGETRIRERPASYNGKMQTAKALSYFSPVDANITIRGSSRIPSSTASPSVLTQSRIGRPAGLTSGRRSVGLDPPIENGVGFLGPGVDKQNRGRSGSTLGFGH